MQNIQTVNSRQELAVHIVELHKVQPVLVLNLVYVLRRVTLRRRVRGGRRERVQLLHIMSIGGGCIGGGCI